MLKNFLIAAYRSMIRNKVSSFISIFGLSVGIACSILAGLYIQYEFSFDKFHENHENIFRLINASFESGEHSPIFPATYLEDVVDGIANVNNAVRVKQWTDGVFSMKNESFIVDRFIFTDPQFFEMFSFQMIVGNKLALDEEFKLFVSQSFAARHFRDSNPLHTIIRYDNAHDFEIVGVFKDFPNNSIFEADLIASFESGRTINPYEFQHWYAKGTHIFLQLDDNTSLDGLAENISLVHNRVKPDYEAEANFQLEPLSDIHLYTYNNRWDTGIKKSDIKVVVGIISFSGFILIISMINYSIMGAARLREKIRQLTIKKIIGASVNQLLWQTLVEVLFMLLLSLVIGYYIIGLLYPFLIDLEEIGILIPSLFSLKFTLYIFGGLAIIFMIISIYPAYEVRKLSVIKSFSIRSNRWKNLMLSGSIAIQFAFTMIIMVSSIIIYRQIHFVTTQKLGFEQEQLLCIDNPWDAEMGVRYERFKQAAMNIAGVAQVTSTRNSPMEPINNGGAFYMMSNRDNWINAGRISVENNFFNVIGAAFIEGKNFKSNFELNKNSIILNRAARDKITEEIVIGKEMTYPSIREEPFIITGIIDNIQHENTLQETRATVYFQCAEDMRGLPDIIVRLDAQDYRNTLMETRELWHSLAPDWPFRFAFMDDRINHVYKNEQKALSFLSYLAIISITMSCIGILGLSWLTIKQRTKEVGIRKVNGANAEDMLLLLNKDYIKWIGLGFIISVPASWFGMNSWLQNFAYKVTIDWWVFFLAGVATLLIALLTVSYHTIKAASSNPVDALRYE